MSQFHFGDIFHGRVASGVSVPSPSAASVSTDTSGGDGRSSQGGKPKTYSVTVLEKPSSLCLGTIGKSNTGVCIKQDCTINHIGPKQEWKEEMLVICKGSNVVFAHPTLLTSKLSQELRDLFLGQSKTLDYWYLVFAYVDELKAPVSIKDLDQRLKEKLAAETFIKTPLINRKPSAEEDDLSFVQVSPFASDDSEGIGARVEAIENYLKENSSKVGNAWDILQRDISQAVTSNVYISTHLDDLLIALGIKTNIAEEFDSPSVWGTLANISKFVSEQESTLRGLAISEAVSRAEDLVTTEAAKLKKFATDNFVPSSVFQHFLDRLGDQLTTDRSQGDAQARAELELVKNRLSLLENRSHSNQTTQGNPQAFNLGRQVNFGISSDPFGLSGNRTNSTSSTNPMVVPTSSGVLSHLEDKLCNIEKELLKIKSDKDSSIVKFGALGFKDMSDAEVYVMSTEGAMNFGLFVDIYVVCILVTKEIDGESDFLKKLENVTKLNLNSLREATGMAAFSSPVPDLFTKAGGGLYGQNESAFSRYPSYQKWKESGKETIPEKLTSVN